jgi:beta-glucosidase/6-phospho-beta-glucosidase/beta-galactosidase
MHPSSLPRPTDPLLAPMELWGGTEATVNRVGDRYFDQTIRSGHHDRLSDLDLIAGLGVRAVRYPVLWERTALDGVRDADWRWADERLTRLRELGVRPIAGLVHHGSGPRHTNLLDPAFPAGLAAYAGAVAERYPWVEEYTPVNEPLTTARFSGLYGQWYPHARDELSFAQALLTQCRAVVEAMAAIRKINPRARLIQTDDLGKTYSTSRLAYQAAFENERRWVSWDLLCGKLDSQTSTMMSLGTCSMKCGPLSDGSGYPRLTWAGSSSTLARRTSSASIITSPASERWMKTSCRIPVTAGAATHGRPTPTWKLRAFGLSLPAAGGC